MQIEKDGFYLNAIGEIIYIKKLMGDYIDENGNDYLIDGTFVGGSTGNYDLIGYIPKELHYGILQKIDNYHKSSSYKEFVNREFEKDRNERFKNKQRAI